MINENNEEFSLTEYIKETFIRRIPLLTLDSQGLPRKDGQHYLSFFLISSAIEFLGACLDNKSFHKGGLIESRFNEALKLFPSSYQNKNLYSD